MPVPLASWQSFLFPALVLWAATGALIIFTFQAHRRREGRVVLSGLATLAVVADVFSPCLSLLAYRQYVAINTQTFEYSIELAPNENAPDSVIVPVPGDESLLANLHATSGTAIWSLVDTAHGRGLRVNFSGAVSLSATFSEPIPPEVPFGHNITPTMYRNGTRYRGDIWTYH